MDEIKVKTSLFRGIISKILSKMIKKKFNVDLNLAFEDIHIKHDGEELKFMVSVQGRVGKDDLKHLIHEAGL